MAQDVWLLLFQIHSGLTPSSSPRQWTQPRLAFHCPCSSPFAFGLTFSLLLPCFQSFWFPQSYLDFFWPTRFPFSPVTAQPHSAPCTRRLQLFFFAFWRLCLLGLAAVLPLPQHCFMLKYTVLQTFLHAFQLLKAFNCRLFPFMIYCCSWCVRIHLQRKLLLYFTCALSGRL